MSSVKTHRGFPVFIHTKQSSCRYTTDFRPPKPRPRPLPAWVTAIGAQERNMRGELSRVGTTKILVAKWWWEQLYKILVGGKMLMQLNDATKEMYEQPNFMNFSGTPNHVSIPFLNQRRNHGIHGKQPCRCPLRNPWCEMYQMLLNNDQKRTWPPGKGRGNTAFLHPSTDFRW
jgi:hypothetical protein